jgi:hypothetical protein
MQGFCCLTDSFLPVQIVRESYPDTCPGEMAEKQIAYCLARAQLCYLRKEPTNSFSPAVIKA